MLEATLILGLVTAHVPFFGPVPEGLVSGIDPVFEAVPTSTVERVGVPAPFPSCGYRVQPRAPEAVQTSEGMTSDGQPEYRHEVRYWLEADPASVCPGPMPPGSFLVDVGQLPAGRHIFRMDGLLDDQVFVSQTVHVEVGSFPSTAISGAWYAPEQSGRGVFVTRVWEPPVDETPLLAIYWATHDAAGQPEWVVAVGETAGATLSATAFNTFGAPLAPGDADLQGRNWGTLQFEYTGCGTATMSWDADDPQVTDGSVDMVQLALPDGIAPCDLRRYTHHPLPAQWQ